MGDADRRLPAAGEMAERSQRPRAELRGHPALSADDHRAARDAASDGRDRRSDTGVAAGVRSGRSSGLVRRFGVMLRGISELCDGNRTSRRAFLAFSFDAINLAQRSRSQITLAAAWAADYWHILDHEQQIAFAITTRDMPYPRARFATVVTDSQIIWLWVIRHRQ